VLVTTVLTRSSYHVVGELPVWLASRGVAAWCIEPVIARGRAAAAFDRQVPRLALALPYALHALTAARERGIASFVRGAPLCMLGPLVELAILAEARAYGAVCASCAARPSCAGADAHYLACFGESELRARDAPRESGETPWVARAFVGPGELGAHPERAGHRRSLDVVP
jgi:hypothetical protein